MAGDLVVHEPDRDMIGTVVLVHGFARSPEDLADLAGRFARRGARVVLPRFSAWWWPTSANNTRYLDRLAERIAAEPVGGALVVVGHSAGAAAGAWITGRLVTAGEMVGALVMIDGVESPVGSIRRSWRLLQDVPITAVAGHPSRCNRHGALERWLARRSDEGEPHARIIRMPDLGHGDVEGPGRSVYVRLCGDDPKAPSRAHLVHVVEEAVIRGLDADAN